MSDIEKSDNPEIEHEGEFGENGLEASKKKVSTLFQQLEILALQKQRGGKDSLDIGKFDKPQMDHLLQILDNNEQNAYNYHMKHLDATKEIEMKKIDASVVDQRTRRYYILGVLIIISVITVVILFLKESYFSTWLTMLGTAFGGAGASQLLNKSKTQENKNELSKDD